MPAFCIGLLKYGNMKCISNTRAGVSLQIIDTVCNHKSFILKPSAAISEALYR